jgi:hypothetical protein
MQSVHSPPSALSWPAEQSTHSVCEALLVLPAAQLVHAPPATLILPSAQATHAPPAMLLVPAAQGMHAPPDVLLCPAAQFAHSPPAGLDCPAAQGTHAVCDALLLWPAIQFMHSPPGAALTFPSAQVMHMPLAGLLDPAGQGWQPSSAVGCSPAAHESQVGEPCGAELPGGHIVHISFPVIPSVEVLAGQVRHDVICVSPSGR